MAGQPLPKHLNIVAVESNYCSIPPLSVPEGYTFTLTTYDRSTPEEVAERIRDADIAITIVAPFTAEALAETNSPRLRMIATISSGTDQVDLKACATRGITVLNSPNCNTNTVAEHALATYFAVRRAFVPCMHKLNHNEWVRTGVLVKTMYTHGATQPPRTLSQEVVAIVGYGAVGKAVQARFEALGATVRIVARKGVVPTADSGRISFEQALAEATVLVLCCPRTAETEGLLGAKEFAAMRPDAVLVNMSRGRVVNEQALLDALRNREISGAGVDVFEVEPAGPENSVLVGRQDEGLNLVLSPHTAWSSLDTGRELPAGVSAERSGICAGQGEPGAGGGVGLGRKGWCRIFTGSSEWKHDNDNQCIRKLEPSRFLRIRVTDCLRRRRGREKRKWIV